MGVDEEGRITVADEVHTPDSSRYWVAASYEERFAKGQEPESLDKEFFRLWITNLGLDPYKPSDQTAIRAAITDQVRLALAAKYIGLYETMTGEKFQLPSNADVLGRMKENLKGYRVRS